MARQVVKRVKGAAVAMMTVPPAPPAKVSAKLRRTEAQLAASMTLPTEPCTVSTDIKDYVLLLYAQGGWGKSTLLCTFPDVAYFGTERAFKGIKNVWAMGPEETGRVITSWEQMLRGVELLEASDRFENVGIDTADRAYAFCMRYKCRQAGVAHPNDARDHGKTWNDIKEEFLGLLNRITATGRGLYITSHVREEKVERASGTEYTRIGPSLTPSAARELIAFVDFCFYGDYVGSAGSGVHRVLFTQGDELIVGKNRKLGTGVKLPEVILLPDQDHEEQDYEYLKAMFDGRLAGVDLGSLVESGRTSKTIKTKIITGKAEAALAQLQGEGVTGA